MVTLVTWGRSEWQCMFSKHISEEQSFRSKLQEVSHFELSNDHCSCFIFLSWIMDNNQVLKEMNHFHLKWKEQCSRHCSVSWFEKAIIFISISASHSNLLLVPICVLHICLKSVDYTISICS